MIVVCTKHDLADHDLDRLDRHGEQAFHSAAFDLPRHRKRGEHRHAHGQEHAEEPRQMLYWVMPSGL
jgi:hypothetical protein